MPPLRFHPWQRQCPAVRRPAPFCASRHRLSPTWQRCCSLYQRASGSRGWPRLQRAAAGIPVWHRLNPNRPGPPVPLPKGGTGPPLSYPGPGRIFWGGAWHRSWDSGSCPPLLACPACALTGPAGGSFPHRRCTGLYTPGRRRGTALLAAAPLKKGCPWGFCGKSSTCCGPRGRLAGAVASPGASLASYQRCPLFLLAPFAVWPCPAPFAP